MSADLLFPEPPPVLAPTPEQRAAADPMTSAWVGANAGSGKTRVLINRVARLLLAGTAPERILCLTYTKAAAAEMQTRLFRQLGQWSMREDAALAAELAALTGDGTAPGRDDLAGARRLFAHALETPGGLHIKTIHAFCEALLRRFPLEAGIAPGFRTADERTARDLAGGVRADLGLLAERGAETSLDAIAARLGEDGVASLAEALLRHRDHLPTTLGAAKARLGAHFKPWALGGRAAAEVEIARGLDWDAVRAFARAIEPGGTKAQLAAAALADAAARASSAPSQAIAQFLGGLLTQKNEARSMRGIVTAALAKKRPDLTDTFDQLTAAALDVVERLASVDVAARARDLNAYAVAFLPRYEAAKAACGTLDFDDLVARTARLMAGNQGAWVLYKLDGGIDHILVDEAQDTAPAQWDVISAIWAEFFSGHGRRGAAGRTLFVVGDEKQSIFSFQGADPQVFGEKRAAFATQMHEAGLPFATPELAQSFRSAPGVLGFVDRVFEGAAGQGLTLDGMPARHVAAKAGLGATIDLWAPVVAETAGEGPEWWAPVDAPRADDPERRLATALAAEIARMIAEDRLPGEHGAPGRPIRAGDVMILLKRRKALPVLVRALKGAGVPVAGADRVVLVDEIAVQDLLACLRVAALPEDDLSLAALLRSPLAEVSEDDLMTLAMGRAEGEALVERLRAHAHAHPRAAALVEDLTRRADYLRPYELLEQVLIDHDGRAHLIARLGEEAEDAIDELLTQALAYEAERPPTLTGFLARIDAGDVIVKRTLDQAGGAVRIMTVHGAKGLEAPVVVLPDTLAEVGAGARGGERQSLMRAPGQGNAPALMLWPEAKGADDALTRRARRAADLAAIAEHKRLLYVALTRAESRLLLCAAGTPKEPEPLDPADRDAPRPKAAVWYAMLKAAFGAGREIEAPMGIEKAWRLGEDPARAPSEGEPSDRSARPVLPAYARPAPYEARPRRIAPSTLGRETPSAPGAEHDTRSAEDARLRGLAVHALLERLPAMAPAARGEAARGIAERAAPGLDDDALRAAVVEAQAVLALPAATTVFAPGTLAEVGLSLCVDAEGGRMTGRADRVVVAPDHVLVVDIKTDRRVPADPGEVTIAYRAQLGAYAASLAVLYPDRRIEAAILWTATPALMRLDGADCRAAWATLARDDLS